MKIINLILIVLLCALYSSPNFAATPKDIRFLSKNKSLFSGTHYVYQVYCSDGRKGNISAWEKKRKWCKGRKKKRCFRKQMRAAKSVCR